MVRANELSTVAILDGLRAGRSWIAESATVELAFTASAGGRRAGSGERLATRGEAAVVRVKVRGVPSGTVSLHTEAGTAHRAALPDTGAGAVEWRTGADESGFVRVEVRHSHGHMAARGNPVILG
ncbi:hypothetical protein [Streptomyces sp. PT12]|uniref:hypothetical protein n=1 Tax=Streptomyces sp. PT12 TaxID=1510197 RepID=UPI000DE33D02|nr:hypothetical protein [Streptomyces sp. PT12]RBM23322.1 hypothetical protein DEH69_03140 [Streptomyces sp. PT12]